MTEVRQRLWTQLCYYCCMRIGIRRLVVTPLLLAVVFVRHFAAPRSRSAAARLAGRHCTLAAWLVRPIAGRQSVRLRQLLLLACQAMELDTGPAVASAPYLVMGGVDKICSSQLLVMSSSQVYLRRKTIHVLVMKTIGRLLERITQSYWPPMITTGNSKLI